ncbi:hypothetical protein FEP08_02344 [Burkholderia multivorans]|nr:hypothetical protein [Burkholderia multivorans]
MRAVAAVAWGSAMDLAGARFGATIHQVGTPLHGRRALAARAPGASGCAPSSVAKRGYFNAAISFARISLARSTLRLMPSKRAA